MHSIPYSSFYNIWPCNASIDVYCTWHIIHEVYLGHNSSNLSRHCPRLGYILSPPSCRRSCMAHTKRRSHSLCWKDSKKGPMEGDYLYIHCHSTCMYIMCMLFTYIGSYNTLLVSIGLITFLIHVNSRGFSYTHAVFTFFEVIPYQEQWKDL